MEELEVECKRCQEKFVGERDIRGYLREIEVKRVPYQVDWVCIWCLGSRSGDRMKDRT